MALPYIRTMAAFSLVTLLRCAIQINLPHMLLSHFNANKVSIEILRIKDAVTIFFRVIRSLGFICGNCNSGIGSTEDKASPSKGQHVNLNDYKFICIYNYRTI